MAFERNADTLLFDPLPDYVFDGRQRATKITPQDVAATIGSKRELAYGKLAEELQEKFDARERTAKSAITRAFEAGTITKNPQTARYEKA